MQLDRRRSRIPPFVDNITVTGFDVLTNGQRSNAGVSFVLLKDWSERKAEAVAPTAVAGALSGRRAGSRTRSSLAVAAAVEGMSNDGGFEGFVQSRSGRLRGARARHAAVASPRPREAPGAGQRRHDVLGAGAARPRRSRPREGQAARRQLGDVNVTLQSTFGALYVNDFNRDGRVYRVQMQSDAKFRAHPEDLRDVSVRSADGAMIPLTAIAAVHEVTGRTSSSASICSRPRGCSASRRRLQLGRGARGDGGGRARKACPTATRSRGRASYQEKSERPDSVAIFVVAVLMVFLILAAQYERFTLPFAVILAVPFAVFGAFLAVWLRGLYNDLYFQIGLVTLVGLAAKNAILIVEFAQLMREGMPLVEARDRSRAPALPADRDDVARVHPRRAAARVQLRRRRRQPAFDRHRRHRRHAARHVHRDVLRPAVLRLDVARFGEGKRAPGAAAPQTESPAAYGAARGPGPCVDAASAPCLRRSQPSLWRAVR